MRVLVTGANGFIGHYVVKALREAGHYPIGLDMVPSNSPTWYEADITKPLDQLDDIDAVIHLAALSHPRQCDENPSKAFDINVNGTSNVLRMALASGARKVVFSSSAHVYDIPPKYLPTDEVHPLRLNNIYTTTKILGEHLCHLYYENHGLSYTTLRLYNAYGPGQARGYFIPDMIAKAKDGSIDLPGGNTTKDWVYVEEVADAFVKAISSEFVGPVNIGTGVETDLAFIAGLITESLGASFNTSSDAKATRMQADISRAQRVLDWQPKTEIHNGLEYILQAERSKVRV